jgi:hypothetical protein
LAQSGRAAKRIEVSAKSLPLLIGPNLDDAIFSLAEQFKSFFLPKNHFLKLNKINF